MRTLLDSTQDLSLEYDVISDIELRKMSAHDPEVLQEEEFDNFEWEFESLVKDWSNAVKLNYYYGSQLGWNAQYDQINELLLPFSGMKNVSLGPEAFAQAVAEWQKSKGFSEKDCDGIIGPQTWGVMEPLLQKSSYITYPTAPNIGSPTTAAPPLSDIAGFNTWHAAQIVDAMNSGLLGTNFDSKTQLSNLANGVQVKYVNPKTKILITIMATRLVGLRIPKYTRTSIEINEQITVTVILYISLSKRLLALKQTSINLKFSKIRECKINTTRSIIS